MSLVHFQKAIFIVMKKSLKSVTTFMQMATIDYLFFTEQYLKKKSSSDIHTSLNALQTLNEYSINL